MSGSAAATVRTADLPEAIRGLSVAPALVAAGIDAPGAERLAEITDQVYFDGAERTERLQRFAVLIVLSAAIAAFGLLADSVAVVIGAMLVAPLMTPILGIAVSLALTEPVRLASSVRTVLLGGTGAVAVGWAVSFASSGAVSLSALPGEIVGRTAPGLLDLGIAVAAGLAAGYLMVDRKAAASAAGVAIAVALVPPLATVGICLELGAVALAAGALLLFSTNLIAIVLSAAAAVVAARVLPRGFLRVRFRQLRAGFAAVLVATVAVTVPLAVHTWRTIEMERFERLVAVAVRDWDRRSSILSLKVAAGEVWDVRLRISSAAGRAPAWKLAERITARTGRPVELDLAYVTEEEDRASTR